MPVLNACTIVSKNYIAYARVLCRSFLQHHPDGRFFVLLVDRNDGYLDPAAEPFEIYEAEDLAERVPHLPGFLFKYTLLECNTACKPYFLEHLIEEHGLDNLVYFDPDIEILGSLDRLASLVDEHSVVLTPHLNAPINDDAHPGEQAILQAGAYNLGFVALGAGADQPDGTVRRLLRWWQDRLYDRCVVRIDQGLFVDQKWMDLVPGMFEGVYILTDPGYNVAYWNLHARSVEIIAQNPTSNGRPLIFFHYSGIRPESLQGVSKHQDRFTLDDIGGAADLYRAYAARVLDAGFADSRGWPYAFGIFDNGIAIPDLARSLYFELSDARRISFGNPFVTASANSFFTWLNGADKPLLFSGEGHLSRLLAFWHRSRADLQAAYPSPAGADLAAFGTWIKTMGARELKLDPRFLADLPQESPADLMSPRSLKRRIASRLKRAYHSSAAKKVKSSIKDLLGAERSRQLKQRLKVRIKGRPDAKTIPAMLGTQPTTVIDNLGINVVGYLDAETGMGEAGRGMVQALERAGIPTSRHVLGLGVVARREDRTFEASSSSFPHDINLFVLNADQVLPVRDHLGSEVYERRYNIGLWMWEQETFPHALMPAFAPLDEVWTSSTFSLQALSDVSPVPVRRMPLPIVPRTSVAADRQRFDLPDDAVVFLFMWNYLSFAERKNPYATVRAFKKAFGDDPSRVLVLKTSQKDHAPKDHRRLMEAVGDAKNIRVMDDYLSRHEIDQLFASSDAYVSLHRSEGFGLTVAEAMLHGKPVVATAYSATNDFFDLNNGYPVRYDLIQLEHDVGPYPAGSRWADADVEHAAEQMRRVVDDPATRRLRVARARHDIELALSVDAVARQLRARFDDIVTRHAEVPSVGIGLG